MDRLSISWPVIAALMIALIGYETVRFGEFRDRVRHDPAHEG